MTESFQGRILLFIIAWSHASLTFGGDFQLQNRALTYGTQGHFLLSKNDFIELSEKISNTEINNTIDEQGRSIAALGFIYIMKQIANDCSSNKLSETLCKLLFQSALIATKNDLKESVLLVNKVIASEPKYPMSYLLLGRFSSRSCLEGGKDCQMAIDAYKKSLEYDPNIGVTYLDLGAAYMANRQLERAINTYQLAITLNTGRHMVGWTHEQLALLYAMQENWDLADRHAKLSSSLGMSLPSDIVLGIEGSLHRKSSGNEELFNAVINGDLKAVEDLLDKGVSVDEKFSSGGTLLHGAALNGQDGVVRLLIHRGADIDTKDDKYGTTPLHLAAYKGYKNVVQILLEKGADLNVKDREGDTPLDNALEGGHREVVEIMKKHIGRQ